MICSTADGEPLWAKLRPSSATANDIADHLEVLDAAVGVLPETDAAGQLGVRVGCVPTGRSAAVSREPHH